MQENLDPPAADNLYLEMSILGLLYNSNTHYPCLCD